MTRSRILRGVARALIVMVSVACGVGAGVFVGIAYVGAFMPNAELEGVVPPVVGGGLGSIAGAFVALAVLFKVRRVEREWATMLGVVAAALMVVGSLGYLGTRGGQSADVLYVLAALLPLGVLLALMIGSSLALGRRDSSGADPGGHAPR